MHLGTTRLSSQIKGPFLDQPPQTPPSNFPLPLIILIIALGVVALGLISYISLKRVKAARRTKLEKFLSKCSDISNINDVIVIDSKSGIDIYSQSFGGRKLDSVIMQTDFVNLKLIVTLKENPSANFKFIMEDLAYDIFTQYGEEIDKFTGILKPFQNMKGLINKHLNTSFLSKLKIVENPKIKLTSAEKEMVAKAKTYMKENNFDHFYSLYLMPANACTPKDYQRFFNLIEKGIFKPTGEENEFFPRDDLSKFKFDDDDKDRFPFPYIFNHPRPPDDFAPAAQVHVIKPSKEEDAEDKVKCQYCGMELTKDEYLTHSCKKKPE